MIRAVGRALAIFDAFDNEHLSLTLQELSERIRMPKTTTFRLVATLERAGFLIRMDNQQYCLSLKLARLGGLVRGTLSIREIARPVMLQVNEQTQETVTLNTMVGTERMVLEVVDTPSPLMSMARLGPAPTALSRRRWPHHHGLHGARRAGEGAEEERAAGLRSRRRSTENSRASAARATRSRAASAFPA
jgi:hypothetical protein